jgi:hypothetical protein
VKRSSSKRVLGTTLGVLAVAGLAGFLLGFPQRFQSQFGVNLENPSASENQSAPASEAVSTASNPTNGRPQLNPLPTAEVVWECEVIVVGGSLGGVAAASHAMQSGATTCLIELAPWLGGQISAQAVSAIDESLTMRAEQNFSQSWFKFKGLIEQQPVELPDWTNLPESQRVADINRCWVGTLCFPPKAGAMAAEQLLQNSMQRASGSRWQTSTAFKGAEFDATGTEITAIYAVQRIPQDSQYVPQGRLSQEIADWYSWSDSEAFSKIPLRLQAPAGKRLIVVDATDTGELVGWANIPHRLGSESRTTTGEVNASERDNPHCTQAFTFPFAIALHNDQGESLRSLAQVQPDYSREEHRREFALEGFPVFSGRSFFHYRRIVSTTRNDPFTTTPALGDITMVNWNRGNDWTWMNPPLILTDEQLDASGQRQNWLGGMSPIALKHAENHALLFAQWLMETQSQPNFPLAYLSGADAPMGTVSGLSMVPYIREGRRILGRGAYGQEEFMMREADLRMDQAGGRDFNRTAIAITHYDIDIHGCRYRNWEPSWEAGSAPAREFKVRPVVIPLESLIPQGVDNLLIGSKGIAVTHIVNALTRIHHSEWSIGAAAGATAGWLITEAQPDLTPAQIPQQPIEELQQHFLDQGLRLDW